MEAAAVGCLALALLALAAILLVSHIGGLQRLRADVDRHETELSKHTARMTRQDARIADQAELVRQAGEFTRAIWAARARRDESVH